MSSHACNGCYYHKPLYRGKDPICCCHYLLIENEKRGCPPGRECSRRLELDEEAAALKDRNYLNSTFNRASDY